MATSPLLANYSNVFRTRVSDAHACYPMLDHLRSQQYKIIGALSEDNDYPKDCTRTLADLATTHGITFIEQTFPTEDRIIGQQLEKLRGHNPDAIFISTQGEDSYYELLLQVRKAFGNLQVLGSAMPGSSGHVWASTRSTKTSRMPPQVKPTENASSSLTP